MIDRPSRRIAARLIGSGALITLLVLFGLVGTARESESGNDAAIALWGTSGCRAWANVLLAGPPAVPATVDGWTTPEEDVWVGSAEGAIDALGGTAVLRTDWTVWIALGIGEQQYLRELRRYEVEGREVWMLGDTVRKVPCPEPVLDD